ncbi:hypothetical protein TREMEDRAFT_61190 [Tremella mesenterica DSM 1558]|uniref:uncharacterized protein n=1 Tax=Tremella mesenterica (strain ATCC 24925 / CBS 8224 / DSM 1558 / NBRC 9311 / NRRL Y-6157 / RJB 2259-6 / UBC 559-6) TaxID=578456 RepID=UPI0003F49DA6|nr:uncharacterized protein TREMEDRAFT_61190 [Tremella mesenterica DSM 1558]EIW70682.1 hypothetical protein TREMEDRAFT_61190 [Tremella mesenterica DSM 1558]
MSIAEEHCLWDEIIVHIMSPAECCGKTLVGIADTDHLRYSTAFGYGMTGRIFRLVNGLFYNITCMSWNWCDVNLVFSHGKVVILVLTSKKDTPSFGLHYSQHPFTLGQNPIVNTRTKVEGYNLRVKESYHRAVQRTTAKLAAVHRRSSYHLPLDVSLRRISRGLSTVAGRRTTAKLAADDHLIIYHSMYYYGKLAKVCRPSLDFRQTHGLRRHAYFCLQSTAYYTQHENSREGKDYNGFLRRTTPPGRMPNL